MTALLEVRNIACRYGETAAVVDASFELEEGMQASLLGPSGCGKTTVLRAIAGFQPLAAGSIHLSGRRIAGVDGGVPPERRGLSMVFQDHALFPHLTVAKNVAAGLHKMPAAEQHRRAHAMLEKVNLSGLHRRYPHELSGGQQQRVALARALAPNPHLLLMDEPFSNLDPDLRDKLRVEVRALLRDIGATCLLVTHEQQDAFAFGQRVGVMQAGRIEQWSAAYRIYHEPATRFVADFIGEGVFIDGVVASATRIDTELAALHGEVAQPIGARVKVLIRPDDILHDDASPRTARIVARAFRGENYLYTLALPSGAEVLSLVPSHHRHAVGEALGIVIAIDHLVVFPA